MNKDKLPNYIAKHLNRLTFPVIIKFDDKYPFMHYADNEKELGKVFVKVLEDRLDDWFYEDKIPEDQIPLTIEQIEKLPECYKKDALEKQEHYIKRQREVEENNRIYKLAHEAVAEKSGEKAWECIQSQSDGEYGYYEIIPIEKLRI